MSVTSTATRVQYQGNGSSSDPYPTGFVFLDKTWVRVIITSASGVDVELELDSDFTVSGIGDLSGGNIVTNLAYGSTWTITIFRSIPITQEKNLGYNERIPSALLESALDKLTMIAQQLAGSDATGDRSIKFPFSEPASNDTTLPAPVDRRDQVMYFDQTTGEMVLIRMDQLAQRLLSILGAEAVLPYRTREASSSMVLSQEDINSNIRFNSATSCTVTLPTTEDFSDEFFCSFSRFGSGDVTFVAASGVTIESDRGFLRVYGQRTEVVVQRIGNNRWWIRGDLF